MPTTSSVCSTRSTCPRPPRWRTRPALGADLVWLAACGHYPWGQHPTAFPDAITRWLGRD
ncbi:hypothetical protein [uncultured Microbacterium sp.]|uniref:hypothetical protein n=1 Tax=Microbacterium laevaniformans TaxID=36807 RepID=UPI0025CE5C07|nr:hypothetical protein [uncultured Microbacterium sp.]